MHAVMQLCGRGFLGLLSTVTLSMAFAVQQGVESVIFLAGVSGTSAPTAIPLSAVVGIIIGCTCGVLLYYSCAYLIRIYLGF